MIGSHVKSTLIFFLNIAQCYIVGLDKMIYLFSVYSNITMKKQAPKLEPCMHIMHTYFGGILLKGTA